MLASDLSSQRRRPEELEETELSPISHPLRATTRGGSTIVVFPPIGLEAPDDKSR